MRITGLLLFSAGFAIFFAILGSLVGYTELILAIGFIASIFSMIVGLALMT